MTSAAHEPMKPLTAPASTRRTWDAGMWPSLAIGMIWLVVGLDALVFTGGVGENSAAVRDGVCTRLAFLGVGTDAIAVHVIEAREDVVAAREARRVLGL